MYFGDQQIENLEAVHPQYEEQERSYTIMQDCFDGEMVIKEKGPEYLDPLYGQEAAQYNAYKNRAYFYGATNRVVRGSVGMLLANPPSLHTDANKKGDETMQEFYDGLASDNSSFMELLRRISLEFVMKGRVGLFVDGERDGDMFRPKIIRYRAEDVINWDYDRMAEGLPWKLRYVVLREDRFVEKDDTPWDRKRGTQWRVLWLDPETGFYNQAVYVKLEPESSKTMPYAVDYAPPGDKKAPKYEKIENSHIVPTKGGQPMTDIPFWILNYAGDSGAFEQPPLLELALMNISHYRSVAQIENARSYAGVPTVILKGTGNQVGLSNIQLGTGKAISLEEPDSDVNFLEMSGSALSSLEKAMEEKELKMALLGGRMLSPEPERTAGEATATHKLRRKGEMSVLASMSDTISNKMTSLVRFAAEWGMKANPEMYRVLLVKEFSTLTPDSTLLVTLSKLVSMKLISFESWFDILLKMELLPTGTDLATELERIESGQGSDIIASLIEMENAPAVEKIDVEKVNGNSNGNGEKPR